MQTMFNCSNIRRIIIKSSIRFNSNHRILNLELIQLYNFTPLILFYHTFLLQILNNRRNHFIIKALASLIYNDTQSFIHLIELLPWQVTYNLPSFNSLLIITLELDDCISRSGTEFIILIEGFLRLHIKVLQITEIRLFFEVIRMILYHLRDQHTKLRSPITYMIDSIDLESHSFE